MNDDVVPYPPLIPPNASGRHARFGMVLFLGATTMLFVGLIAGYVILRYSTAGFAGMSMPPRDLVLPEMLAVAVALVMVQVAAAGCRDRLRMRYRLALTLAFVAGIAYLVLVVMHWNVAAAAGLSPGSNMRLATFYLLSGAHGVHLLGGLVPIGYWMVRAWFAPLAWPQLGSIKAVRLYWRFIAALVVVVAVLLYLI